MVSPNGAQNPQSLPMGGGNKGSFYNFALNNEQYLLNDNDFLKSVLQVEEIQLQRQNPSSILLGNFDSKGPLSNISSTSSGSGSGSSTAEEAWGEKLQFQIQYPGLGDKQSIHQQLNLTAIDSINLENQIADHDHQPIMAVEPMVAVSQHQANWFQFQLAAIQQQQQMTTSMAEYNSSVLDVVYSDSKVAMPAVPRTTSLDSQGPHEKKRRRSDDMMDKTIERRQKRMIKNRESAARSRARKQAYTNQLENEAMRLRKLNSWLKKKKEVETLLSSSSTPIMPKHKMRRTKSACF